MKIETASFSVIKNKFHPAADAYFRRIYALSGQNVLDKGNINALLVLFSKINILPYLVDGWLFRSIQNAGTGTVIYGLKGIYDLTSTNGPTWDINGMVFEALSSQFASNNSLQINNEYTMLTVYAYNNSPTSGVDDIVISSDPYQGGILYGDNTLGLIYIGGGDINGDNGSQIIEGTIPIANEFLFTLAAVNPSNIFFQVNQNIPKNISGSYSAVKNHVRINGDSSISRCANCKVAAHILFNKDISSLSIQLNQILKQTISQGLGL